MPRASLWGYSWKALANPKVEQGKDSSTPRIIGLYPSGDFLNFIYLLKPVRWGTLDPYTLLGGCLIRSMPQKFGRKTRHFTYKHNYKQSSLEKINFCLIILFVAKVFVHQFAHWNSSDWIWGTFHMMKAYHSEIGPSFEWPWDELLVLLMRHGMAG